MFAGDITRCPDAPDSLGYSCIRWGINSAAACQMACESQMVISPFIWNVWCCSANPGAATHGPVSLGKSVGLCFTVVVSLQKKTQGREFLGKNVLLYLTVFLIVIFWKRNLSEDTNMSDSTQVFSPHSENFVAHDFRTHHRDFLC